MVGGMKVKFIAKHIKFVETEIEYGRPVYEIRNNKTNGILGQVGWYPAWKQYVAHFEEMSVWSHDCLEDVRQFILKEKSDGAVQQEG